MSKREEIIARHALFDEEAQIPETQNREYVSQSSSRLARAVALAEDADRIGQEALTNLRTDRESLTRALDRTMQADAELSRANRTLHMMRLRHITDSAVTLAGFVVVFLVLILLIYLALR